MALAGAVHIAGQQAKEQAGKGRLPTGCSWIEKHLESPAHQLAHASFKRDSGLVWCRSLPRQMVQWVGMRCAWAAMWVMEVH